MSQPAALEDVVRPLDSARRALLRTTWRVPLLGRAMRSVDTRLPLLATMSVASAFLVTCFAPGLLFVLGPALLGVPHVASDVRYLVLRQPRLAGWTATIALGIAALILLRVAEMLAPRALPFALVEVATGCTWVGMAAWMGARAHSARPRWWRAGLVTLLVTALATSAIAHPEQARALLAYGHNLVAPLIWVVLFRGRKMRALLPITLIGVGACLLLLGVSRPFLRFDDPWVAALARDARIAAPTLAPASALAIGVSYVFLQAVHYSIWLAWIPQERIRENATLTFRMSVRSAKRDFGPWGMGLVLGASLVMIAGSFVAPHRCRHLYLSVATFHVYLELACLAFLWMRHSPASAVASCGADEVMP
jgi:hypothetical protein